MNQLLKRKTLLAVLSCSLANNLYAEDETGFYAGYGLTRSNANASNFKESTTEHGLKLGYMFTDNYGLDMTVTKLADEKRTSGSFNVDLISLSGLGRFEVSNNIAVYGKLGVARILVDIDGDFNTDASSSTDVFAGLGVEYDFGSLNLFIEYNRFDGDKFDSNTLMSGLRFQF